MNGVLFMAQILKDEVKDKIQSSAVKLFTERGFKEASIKEIAKEANVSVGNVYRYYENKEDLYKSVIQGVYEGVQTIMHDVLLSEKYTMVFERNQFDAQMFEPMMHFITLYKQEKAIFTMLLRGEKDQHYEETIVLFIQLLRDYFLRFWGVSTNEKGMSVHEASAFANAIVFAVIDLLNHVEEDELELQLKRFVGHMVTGYFYSKNR